MNYIASILLVLFVKVLYITVVHSNKYSTRLIFDCKSNNTTIVSKSRFNLNYVNVIPSIYYRDLNKDLINTTAASTSLLSTVSTRNVLGLGLPLTVTASITSVRPKNTVIFMAFLKKMCLYFNYCPGTVRLFNIGMGKWGKHFL